MQGHPLSTLNKQRILFVDDHHLIIQLWKILFEHTGRYVVEEVNDSRLTFQVARRFYPDSVVLDLHMPEINGTQIATRLQADDGLRHIPILFLTSSISKQRVAACQHVAGCLCLAKPTNSRELVKAVNSLLAQGLPKLPPPS